MPDAARKSVADAQPRTPVIAPDTRAHSVALVWLSARQLRQGEEAKDSFEGGGGACFLGLGLPVRPQTMTQDRPMDPGPPQRRGHDESPQRLNRTAHGGLHMSRCNSARSAPPLS